MQPLSISTVVLTVECDSTLAYNIAAANTDAKDCEIRKSFLASQYYLF